MGYYNKFPLLFSSGVAVDPDAATYISTLGLTGLDATATNQLFLDLKSYSLYNKIYFGHFGCWNDATKNAYDFKLNVNKTFVGGLTHASGYVTSNGTTGYDYVSVSPQSYPFLLNDHGFTYKNYKAVPMANAFAFGIVFGSYHMSKLTSSQFQSYINDVTGAFDNTGYTGIFSGNRIDSTTVVNYKDGALLSSHVSNSTSLAGDSGANKNITGFGYNLTNLSDLSLNMVFQHSSFNATEVANMNTCINTFLTTLGI